jgi:hypothetical protein
MRFIDLSVLENKLKVLLLTISKQIRQNVYMFDLKDVLKIIVLLLHHIWNSTK